MPENSSAASARRSSQAIDRPPAGVQGGRRVRPATDGGPATRRLEVAVAGDDTLRAIVDRLLLGMASAAEVALDLGLDAQDVRNLLRRLVRGGVVERGEKCDRRGVSEFLYSCDPRRTALSSDRLSGLPAAEVERAVARVLRELFREAMAASEAGSYFSGDEFIATRFPLPLDKAGRRDIGLLPAHLLEAIAEARLGAAARLARGAEAVEATAAILLFEIPGSRWPPPFAPGELPSGPVCRSSIRHRVETLLTDPLRQRIAEALTMRPATAVELAAEIGAPLARVRYELRAFEKASMVKVHCCRERRGAVEYVFVADSRQMTLFGTDLAVRGERARHAWGTEWMRLVFREAVEGVRDGSFDPRGDWRLGRVPLRLDRQGFAEISASMDSTLEELFELRDECFLRRAHDDPAAVRPAFFDLFLFEKPNPVLERS